MWYFLFMLPDWNVMEEERIISIFSTKRTRVIERRSSMTSRNHVRSLLPLNGFTLMELLIVMAVIMILMLMSMGTYGSIKKHANEISAINSIRVIAASETMYMTSYPIRGFACTLTALGGSPAMGDPTSDAAQLLQPDLASGYKAGYLFKISTCTKSGTGGMDHAKNYIITAVPLAVGRTGNRSFCYDQEDGVLRYDPAGGTQCSQMLQ
jgi:type IV pilus assembly protein PilA